MLVYNQRMTDTVIHRCHMPSDGDLMVPIHTVAILGTTDVRVTDPEDDTVGRGDVEKLIAEGEKLFPAIRQMRILRAYAGVRPLYQPPATGQTSENRSVSRAHVVIDHNERDGVDNFVSIVGGKLTTYRMMAQDTTDVVARRLGVTEKCSTADEILPNQGEAPGKGQAKSYWLGHRLAEHEADGGGDANLMCECEFVTRPMLDEFLDRALALHARRRAARHAVGHGSVPGRLLHVPGRWRDRRAGGSIRTPEWIRWTSIGQSRATCPSGSKARGRSRPGASSRSCGWSWGSTSGRSGSTRWSTDPRGPGTVAVGVDGAATPTNGSNSAGGRTSASTGEAADAQR